MKSFPHVFLTGLLLVGLSSQLCAAGDHDEASRTQFEKQVKPVLKQLCIRCHGPEKQEAQLRIDTLSIDLVSSDAGDHWEEVLNQLNLGAMPPEDQPQPTADQRELITSWIHTELKHAAEMRRASGDGSSLRRMTGYEYSNTMRDLLGIDLDFSKDLPPEGVAAEGFKNNNYVLGTSSLHFEQFQAIAEEALRKVLQFGDQPEQIRIQVEPESQQVENPYAADPGRYNSPDAEQIDMSVSLGERTETGVLLWNKPFDPNGPKKNARRFGKYPGSFVDVRDVQLSGPVRIRVKAGGVPNERGDWPRMLVQFGYFLSNFKETGDVGEVEVAASPDDPAVYEFHVRSERFPTTGELVSYLRVSNPFDPGTLTLPKEEHPKLFIDSVEIVIESYDSWPPKTHSDILFDSELATRDVDEYVRQVIEKFMTRAYRRPPTDQEVSRMLLLYDRLHSQNGTFEESIIGTLSAVLCAPGFLMLDKPADSPASKTPAKQLNDYELASRLSYFLWSTMPDDQLFELARKGELHQPGVLRKQVLRMLDDPRSDEFVEHFCSQWLNLDSVYTVMINPEYFPRFPETHKDLMHQETTEFFRAVLKENLNALSLIDSDFTMLNAPLAKYYGIEGVGGSQFRKVALSPEHHRGGILTHASVLLGNSSGDDTHPIKRGVWVLERLLGDPPPPPPPAVPTLAEDDQTGEPQSLKDKLIAHRESEACMNCHRKIDPWGIAFENYNGIGVWRDSTVKEESGSPVTASENSQSPKKQPARKRAARKPKRISEVDPRTTLANGTDIQDLDELKAYLIEHKRDQFAETLVRKLLAYSLGRYLEFTDTESVKNLASDFREDEYRLKDLIVAIVLSETFKTR
jgi:hypothetical protein